MGQYYHVAFKNANGEVIVNGRSVEGVGYIMAKLLEHGYVKNPLCMAVAKGLYDGDIKRLMWVGDYADDDVSSVTNGEVKYDDVWGEKEHTHEFKAVEFDWSGKFLVNHTKKVCISLDEYLKKAKDKWGYTICPFTILTAVGNGRGGGDYSGECESLVGTWAWDEIGILDSAPDGYENTLPLFIER